MTGTTTGAPPTAGPCPPSRRDDAQARPTLGALAALLALTMPGTVLAALQPATPPRLVVLICVDQLRRDSLERWRAALGDDGLLRLVDGGASFPEAAHTHTVTSTGPGHAALATGCLPAKAGIPANQWLDRDTGGKVYCVADRDARTVGSVEGVAARPVSPALLERPTLGDLLHDRDRRTLVVSLGWKDRAALFLGGQRSDGTYWIDGATGTFVTSSTLVLELPAPFMRHDLSAWTDGRDLDEWIVALNAEGPLAALAGRVWERTLDEPLALRLAGPDLGAGEPPVPFPHPLGAPPPMGAFVERVGTSPFGDAIVLAAARRALAGLPLGQDEVPDLLCLTFASLDMAGHAFGPDSQEVLDVVVQLDRRLAELLALLDARVGPGAWTLALTSDHGVAPLPEQSGGLRFTQEALAAAVEAALVEELGPAPAGGRWVAGIAKPSLYLDARTLAACDLGPAELATAAARALDEQPGIAAAATLSELAAAEEPGLVALAQDVHPTRSGQVLFLLERLAVLGPETGTDHGSHHDYDREVPVLFFGHGIAPGRHPGPAAPIDIVPTLAQLLGLESEGDWDGRVLEAALADGD